MKRMLSSIVLLGLLGVLASCSSEKGAATAAIQSAESSWAAARDNVMKVMPSDARMLDEAIASAKTSLEQGDAKAALAASKDLPAKIQELTAGLQAKETELRAQWTALSEGLPGVITTVQERVDKLSKSRTLPAGIDQPVFDEAKTSMTSAIQLWAEAQADQNNGNIGDAVTKAVGVRDLLVKALNGLKLPVPPALQA